MLPLLETARPLAVGGVTLPEFAFLAIAKKISCYKIVIMPAFKTGLAAAAYAKKHIKGKLAAYVGTGRTCLA